MHIVYAKVVYRNVAPSISPTQFGRVFSWYIWLNLAQVKEIRALFRMFKEIVNLQFVEINVIVARISVAFVIVMVPTASADGAVMAIVIVFAAPIVIEVGVAALDANVLATSGEDEGDTQQ